MTNLHLAILSTVLTLAILAGLWIIHRRVNYALNLLAFNITHAERSLRSHVVDEIDNLETKVVSHVKDEANYLYMDVSCRVSKAETAIVGFVEEHASDLRKHAEDLRNHAKELSDRAEVNSAPPRQAVTRN